MEILLGIIVFIVLIRIYIMAVFSSAPIKKEKLPDHIIVKRFKSYMKRRVEVTYPQWFVLCIGFKVFIFSVGAICS